MIEVARRFVGTVHLYQGRFKSNPVALFASRQGDEFVVAPTVEPWASVVGKGPTINKAAGNFEINWKAQTLPAEDYSGPHWETGIKAEKPPPPKPPTPPSPPAASVKPAPQATSTGNAVTSSGEAKDPTADTAAGEASKT